MRKFISSALAASALAIATSIAMPVAAQAQQPAPSLDQVMSPSEQAAAGIAKLTPAERAALEAWLARYTATVGAVVRGLGPAAVPAAQPAAPPAAAMTPAQPVPTTPAPGATPALPPTAPLGAHVFRSTDGGTFIMLRDGTVWEIFYSDRAYTTVWQAGDFVTVRRSPARVGQFDYQLVNADRSRRVQARFAGFVRTESAGTGGGSNTPQ